ncbi:LysR family transcriptional regulator [Hominifimenecus sp. rT4P-3]|uniref:LysR family transcriptional regulator n=1 Tax=Hominifimenecus sp. rT4P-3 TaxID=3242979 RepID=UPI003DA4202A
MLKEMIYVYTVYQEQSFSKAARKLFISQPALSAAVKKAETELCAPIFDRSTNPIRLTRAGEYYIQAVEDIMHIQERLKGQLSLLQEAASGHICIGSTTYFCTYILADVLQAFQEKYPAISLSLSEANGPGLEEGLQNGAFDFILDVEPLNKKLFEEVLWGYENVILAVPAAWPVNQDLTAYRLSFQDIREGRHLTDCHPRLSVKVFANEPFLIMKQGNDMYNRSLSICRNAGFTPKIRMYLDQLMTSYHLACDGKGIAFIRDSIPQHVSATDQVFFYKIDDQLAKRQISLSYQKAASLSGAAQTFLDYIQNLKR